MKDDLFKLCEITGNNRLNNFKMKFVKTDYFNFNKSTFVFMIFFSSLAFIIGFLPTAFALEVRFLESEDGNNFYIIEHGATIVVDGTLDLEYRDGNVTTKNVIVKRVDNGSQCQITLTESGPDTGWFTYPYYFKFTGSTGSCGVPSLQVKSTGSDTTIDAWATSHPSLIKTTTVKFSQTYGSNNNNNPNNQPIATSVPCDSTNGYDVDNDRICGNWETASGLNIPYGTATGAAAYMYPCDPICPSPTVKDVYVEIDWLKKHPPNQLAINNVKSQYAAKGINLHIQNGEEINYHVKDMAKPDSGQSNDNQYDLVKNYNFGTLAERVTNNEPFNSQIRDRLTAKSLVFHYALFAHQIVGTSGTTSTSSGSAETPGNDILVTLGARAGGYGTVDEQAGTFMHELGHNLYLDHFGPRKKNSTGDLCKPNYPSVMNYAYQFSDFGFTRPLEYSSGVCFNGTSGTGGLLEGSLAENTGIGTGCYGKMVVYGDNTAGTSHTDLNDPPTPGGVDWNLAGGTTGTVAANINKITAIGCSSTSSSDALEDYNDWSNLDLAIIVNGEWLDGAPYGEGDGDGDGDLDEADNCLSVSNPDQENLDGDAYGAACDEDDSDELISYNTSTIPDVRSVFDNEKDSSIVLIGIEEQNDETIYPEASLQECECPENVTKNDIVLKERMMQSDRDSLIDPEEPEHEDHNTLEQSQEARYMTVQAIIDNLDKLSNDDCNFKESIKSQCIDNSEKIKDLKNDLHDIQLLLKNDTFAEAGKRIHDARQLASEVISNPVSQAQIVGMIGGVSATLQSASIVQEIPYTTLDDSLKTIIGLLGEFLGLFVRYWHLIIILLVFAFGLAGLSGFFGFKWNSRSKDLKGVFGKVWGPTIGKLKVILDNQKNIADWNSNVNEFIKKHQDIYNRDAVKDDQPA
jgi:hypothetical protein